MPESDKNGIKRLGECEDIRILDEERIMSFTMLGVKYGVTVKRYRNLDLVDGLLHLALAMPGGQVISLASTYKNGEEEATFNRMLIAAKQVILRGMRG